MRAVPDREEVSQIVQGVYSGSLANKLKNNSSYSLTGIGVGAIGGMILASFFGKSKLIWGLGGAVIGGAGGYFMSNKLSD